MTTREHFCDNCGAENPPTARFCQYCAEPLLFKHTTGSLPEQTLLNGRYQLDCRIGQGGMGAVYKAADTSFNNRSVAVKEMSRAGLTPTRIQDAEESFQREANMLASLLHRNLPRIYDNFTEDERSYLVMDFIEGQTLEDYLEQANGKPMPLEQVLDWSLELCDVLSYLHDQSPPIIFRDLKPSNVMIDKRGHIFLIDFGIARIFKPGKSHDTVALGSPGYAAPEQYGKSQSTPRSDIYSLGALLHCLLTGVDPSEQPFFFQSASRLNAAIPAELDALLKQMLEMDTDKRPASTQEVANKLRAIEKKRTSDTLSQPTVSYTSSIPSKTTHTSSLLQDAYTLYTQKKVKDAIAVYDRALKTDAMNPQIWLSRGLALAHNGQHREALASFNQALKFEKSLSDKELITVFVGQGAALSKLGRNKEALEAFDRALAPETNNAPAWNGKGVAQSALGQLEAALSSFEIALHYDQYMVWAWHNKGLVLRQLKRYTEAVGAFECALSHDRKNPTFWNSKGLTLYDMGRLKDALQSYQEAVKCNNRYAPSWYGIGNVLYAQQVFDGALEAYNSALEREPSFVKAWDRRGNLLVDMRQYETALRSYNEAIRLDPRYAPALNGKANVLCHLGRYSDALDSYNQALTINPNAPLAWNGQGNAYFHLGNYQKSLEAYEQATRLYPRMASAWYNKSLVLKHLRRYEDALAAAEKAIQLAPNDPDNWQQKLEALKKLPGRKKERREAESQTQRLRGRI